MLENISRIDKLRYVVTKSINAKDPENEEEEQIVLLMKNYIEKKVFIWDITNADDFKFILPTTVFSEFKKIKFEVFEESEIKYDDSYVSRSLIQDQLKEIWEKGQFSVKSKDAKVPYVWQLSNWLHKGRYSIKASLLYDFGNSFYFLYELKSRFSLKRKNSAFSVPYSIYNVVHTVKDFWAIFFGRLRMDRDYMNAIRYPTSYLDLNLFKDYQKNLLNDNPKIMTSVFYPKFQTKINTIYNEFCIRWSDESIVIEHDLREQELTATEIKEKLSNIRFEKLVEEYENSMKLDEKRKRYFIDLIKSERIYNKIMFEHNSNLNQLNIKLYTEIAEEHPIRCQTPNWFNIELKRREKPELEKLELALNDRIDDALSKFHIHKIQIQSYRIYLKYLEPNRVLALQKLEKGCLRTFYTKRSLMPPYFIRRTENYNKTFNYTLERYENLETKTDCHYWRIKLIFTRLYAYNFNVLIFCYNFCWNSSFGLKALCTKEIVNDYSVDYSTGVRSEQNKSFTYYSSIASLCKSISKSMDDFEKAAENGFLGGKVGRFCNWIENYIGRLIFGGTFVIFLYPVAIILCTLLFFIFTLLGFVFSTLFILLIFIFNTLIYDMDEPDLSKFAIFPLIVIIRKLLFTGIFNLILSLFAIVAQILLSIFMVFWGLLRWTVRSLYDCFTYSIISCNGKIPKADTSFAWKISGPGSNRTLFYKLEIEEALLLIRAQLEKNQLNIVYDKIYEDLKKPEVIHNDIISRTLNNFNGYIVMDNKLTAANWKYQLILDTQRNAREAIYPYIRGNVRFSKDDLEVLLEATYDLVRDFVAQNDLQSIWKKNKLVPNNWRLLTERILIQTFGSEDVLVNVDESDLITEKKKDSVKNDVVQLYDQLGIHKSKERAMVKQSMFSAKNMMKGSGENFDDEDFYHGSNHRTQKVRAQDVADANIVSDININCMNSDHFRIDYSNKNVCDEIRAKQDKEEDEALY